MGFSGEFQREKSAIRTDLQDIKSLHWGKMRSDCLPLGGGPKDRRLLYSDSVNDVVPGGIHHRIVAIIRGGNSKFRKFDTLVPRTTSRNFGLQLLSKHIRFPGVVA